MPRGESGSAAPRYPGVRSVCAWSGIGTLSLSPHILLLCAALFVNILSLRPLGFLPPAELSSQLPGPNTSIALNSTRPGMSLHPYLSLAEQLLIEHANSLHGNMVLSLRFLAYTSTRDRSIDLMPASTVHCGRCELQHPRRYPCTFDQTFSRVSFALFSFDGEVTLACG